MKDTNEDAEIEKTLRAFGTESFPDAGLEWSIERIQRRKEFALVEYRARKTGSIRLIVFRLYGAAAAVCYAWFDEEGKELKMKTIHPQADLTEIKKIMEMNSPDPVRLGGGKRLAGPLVLTFLVLGVLTCRFLFAWSWPASIIVPFAAGIILLNAGYSFTKRKNAIQK